MEIREPDDELAAGVDRQAVQRPAGCHFAEVLSYILANMQRSYAFARKLVAETDNISLARKRAVTIPIVKEALAVLNDDHQGELF